MADRTAALHAQSGDLRATIVTPSRPPLPACSASYTFFLTLPLLYMTCGVLVYLPTLYSALHAFFLCPHLPTVLCSACLSALHMLHWPRGITLVSLDNCCCWCVLYLPVPVLVCCSGTRWPLFDVLLSFPGLVSSSPPAGCGDPAHFHSAHHVIITMAVGTQLCWRLTPFVGCCPCR